MLNLIQFGLVDAVTNHKLLRNNGEFLITLDLDERLLFIKCLKMFHCQWRFHQWN